MNTVMNKAIVIGVAIFITIAITSGIIYTISMIRDIYKEVYETDTSISNRFGEFDAYDDSTKTVLDVINTVNKYKNNNRVKIEFRGYSVVSANVTNNSTGKINGSSYNLNDKYKSNLKINNDDTITIKFSTI